MNAVPGVVSASLAMSLPIVGGYWSSVFIVGDQPLPERAALPSARFVPVAPGFFETIGIRLLEGRTFTRADADPDRFLVVVNETLAHDLWPGQSAIGKRIKQGWPESDTPWREVIGVVADVKDEGLESEVPPQVYTQLANDPDRDVYLTVRTAAQPGAVARAVEAAVREIDPTLPVSEVRTMEAIRSAAIARQRLAMHLLTGFAAVALILAALGVFGVTAYSVSQRTREVAVRMALGAVPPSVLRLIVREELRAPLIGIALGIVGALTLTSWLESLLFEVAPQDLTTLVSVAMILLAVTVVACYLPARRATHIDPGNALRNE
ncbi:MAG: FtsX-like permease family protein [Longimicrobiales bacterium]